MPKGYFFVEVEIADSVAYEAYRTPDWRSAFSRISPDTLALTADAGMQCVHASAPLFSSAKNLVTSSSIVNSSPRSSGSSHARKRRQLRA
jgi:hypothetical protein